MNGGIALPRIRVRSRRRRPRTPAWRFFAFMFAVSLGLIVWDVLAGVPVSAVSAVLQAAYWRRMMRRPIADPEASAPTSREAITDWSLLSAAVVLALVGAVLVIAS